MISAREIAQALGGHRHGSQYRCKCPAHNDHDPSLDVRDTVGGVLVNCKAGCSQRDVIAALVARDLWVGRSPDDYDHAKDEKRQADAERLHKRQEKQRQAWGLSLWDQAYSPYLSPAYYYLCRRGLALPQHAEEVIRFHPECPRGNERVPALLALMRCVITGEPRAVQRIYIRPDFTKDKCEASPNGTKTLGLMRGSAIMLDSYADVFCDGQEFADPLYVTEGLETGIGVQCRGYGPVWALCSTGNIANLPVLHGVSRLVICADNDVPKLHNGEVRTPGLDAARECRARWQEAGHECTIWMPGEAGKDFADDPPH
jgi:putative DNA primase/helicase